jgi:transglutaminase-like putative cysteine protease
MKGFPLPLLLFLLGAAGLGGCKEPKPLISAIEPRIGAMGEIISIRGENFGNGRNESYVSIGGRPPTSSSYLSWTNELIRVRVPEFGEAGLVYVHTGEKRSNPALFSNRAAIPQPVRNPESASGPRIASVTPPSGSIGALITIRGNSFGSSRENSGVFFSWNAESSPSVPPETRSPGQVEVYDAEFGYEFWSEREIRLRVPDGAISGNMEVRTPRGNSPPVFFEIAGMPGTKTFRDKRSYTLSYTVDIRVEDAVSPNALYLWAPKPAVSASQRNLRLLSRNMEPFVEHYRGTSLFQLVDLPPRSVRGISLSYVTDVYAVETEIRTGAVRQEEGSPVHSLFTLPSPLIPSDNGEIKAKADAITGRERNPYLKARRSYEWLVREGGIQAEALGGGALEALQEGRADSYRASLLYSALARAAGIPAIPVAGVLADRTRTAHRHYWAEFWIEGFGWIPLDPALGAGAAPPLFNLRNDRADYYFGSLDNQHIAFSRGQAALSQMDPRGRGAVRVRDYALQNLWEEAVGGLDSYSSLWSDVTITGIFNN